MYIPKTKFKKITGAGKNIIDAVTGSPYTGPIVQDFLGNLLKGSNPFTATATLRDTGSEVQPDDNFKNHYVQPTAKDYERGLFLRYFAKDSRTGKIVELNKESYLKEKTDNKLYRRAIKLEWYLNGPLEDQTIGQYKYPGTRSKNRDVIAQAEKQLSGIGEQILKDPGQFVK